MMISRPEICCSRAAVRAAARKQVMVDKGALRLAQKQLDRLKARANAGELSLKDAHDELEAHSKAVLPRLRTLHPTSYYTLHPKAVLRRTCAPVCGANILCIQLRTDPLLVAGPCLLYLLALSRMPCSPPLSISLTQAHARARAR